jgi:outer membrane lipoprotein-sorting protein
MKYDTHLKLLVVLALSIPLAGIANEEAEGMRIARDWKANDIGWVDYTANVKMILYNKSGDSSVRDFRYITMEVTEDGKRTDGDKVLVIFDKPRDVKDTTLLTYSHFDRDDDQWLYLPVIKRTKRISSHNKSGSFVGSEFAYEDITFQEVEKYTYKLLREEEYNGFECYVVERIPVDRVSTGYSKQIVWYDKEHVRIQKIDFYDRKDALLKTQTFSNWNEYLEGIWRATNEVMQNHQTGKKTMLTWSDYKFHVGLSERQFNKNSLERLR